MPVNRARYVIAPAAMTRSYFFFCGFQLTAWYWTLMAQLQAAPHPLPRDARRCRARARLREEVLRAKGNLPPSETNQVAERPAAVISQDRQEPGRRAGLVPECLFGRSVQPCARRRRFESEW